MLKIGSHVGMNGKEMFLGSVKEAISYGANTFMVYTGAPQNTRRKEISELRIEEGWELMRENGIDEFVVHAPYIINLANTVKLETYELAVEFLAKEIDRTNAMGSTTLVLHPGSHVGAGVDAGIEQIVKGLNTVLTKIHQCILLWRQWQEREVKLDETLRSLPAFMMVLRILINCVFVLILVIRMMQDITLCRTLIR